MAPFLLIDAGNTRVKWATTTRSGAVRLAGEVATNQITAQRAARIAQEYPGHQVVISSVVPAASRILKKAFGRRTTFVTAKSSGLAFDYPRPAELGADRLAAAAAVPGPAIVVSCGTATAFSAVDSQGRFCGGVIAPGLGSQLTALLGSTAQLPDVQLRAVSRALARSTQAAIQAGLILSFQGGVREIVRRLREEMDGKPRIIATGGYAKFLKDCCIGPFELRPLLVFEGLHIIGQRIFTASV